MRTRLIGCLAVGLVVALSTGSVAAQEATSEATPETQANYHFAWPMAMPTADQIREAQACGAFAGNSYPDVLIDVETFVPETACDWAALAVSYAMQREMEGWDSLPDEAVQAFLNAVEQNSALAFIEGMIYGYYGQIPYLVEPPPLANQRVVGITVAHQWSGLGSSDNSHLEYQFDVVLDDSGDTAEVNGTLTLGDNEPTEISAQVDRALVDAITDATLRDLLPMEAQFQWLLCFDVYPDWQVTLTYEDGQSVTVSPNGSNLYVYGAPWQTELDEQQYMGYSNGILDTVEDMVDALELPWGETAASTCGGSQSLLSLAFPTTLDGSTAG